jgi:2-polyprenyl-6-methoxyphenol hydroxylase-like FAD-dependent oxidoreductase
MDAWNLSDQLGTIVNQTEITNDQIEEILSRYENERIPVGSREILGSRDSAAQFHSSSSLTIFFRNNILRMVNLKMQFDNWFYNQS